MARLDAVYAEMPNPMPDFGMQAGKEQGQLESFGSNRNEGPQFRNAR